MNTDIPSARLPVSQPAKALGLNLSAAVDRPVHTGDIRTLRNSLGLNSSSVGIRSAKDAVGVASTAKTRKPARNLLTGKRRFMVCAPLDQRFILWAWRGHPKAAISIKSMPIIPNQAMGVHAGRRSRCLEMLPVRVSRRIASPVAPRLPCNPVPGFAT